jgi:hypothetical protein
VAVIGCVLITLPPLPDTLKLKAPGEATAVALSVSVLVVTPPGKIAGEKAAVTPGGSVPVDSVTADLNPPLAVSFTTLETLDPAVTAREAGAALSRKDGPAASFQ